MLSVIPAFSVKDLPTQAGYAVHSAKQKAKDNVSDFKRGVVEEWENRQEQRTQKRNLHRENISQKKQELQKAQEAKQAVHANGSATAGATRSHERPVATPVLSVIPAFSVRYFPCAGCVSVYAVPVGFPVLPQRHA